MRVYWMAWEARQVEEGRDPMKLRKLFWCWMALLAVLSLLFGILGPFQMVFWVLGIGLSVVVVAAVMMVLIRVVQFFRERRSLF